MRVLLVIDALNQLDEADRAQELHWLPTELPSQMKVIVSCVSDSGKTEPVLEAFHWRKPVPVQVAALSDTEQREIIRQVPSLSAKTLDELQMGLLLSNPATETALFLLVALEELRGFGSFDELDSKIAKFPHPPEQEPRWHRWLLETQSNARNLEVLAQSSGDELEAKKWRTQLDRLELIEPMLQAITPIGDPVTAIFIQVIDRLAGDFNQKLVETVLTLLASARRGLSERELQELVAGLDGADDLFLVLRQLRPYMLSRAGLIHFYHRNLFKAVRERYLPSVEQQRQAHARLAEYFNAQDYWLESLEEKRRRAKTLPPTSRPANVRKVDELPWQLLQAADWQKSEQLLTALAFLEAKAEAGMVFDALRDCDQALEAMDLPAVAFVRNALGAALPAICSRPGLTAQSLYNRLAWSDSREPVSTTTLGDARTYLDEKGLWLKSQAPLPGPRAERTIAVAFGFKSFRQAISFSCKELAVASPEGEVEIRDLTSGELVEQHRLGASHLLAIALGEDRNCLAYAESDGRVRLAAGGVAFPGRPGESCLAYHSAHGVIGVREDDALVAWDPATGEAALLTEALPKPLRVLRISPDGRWILFLAGEKRPKVGIVTRTGAIWKTRLFPSDGPPLVDARLSPEGDKLLLATRDRRLQILDAESWAVHAEIAYEAHPEVTVRGSPEACRVRDG